MPVSVHTGYNKEKLVGAIKSPERIQHLLAANP